MKVTSYFASADTGVARQHLDNWHRFCSVTETTYNTTGQTAMRESLLVVDPTTTLGIAASSSGVSALTGTATLKQALTADSSVVRIAGCYFLVSTGAAAAAAVTGVSIYVGSTAITASAAIAAASRVVVNQGLEVVTKRFAATMNNITVKAHGISIYDNFPSKFFNAYTSYHYGGPNVNVPQDVGALFIPLTKVEEVLLRANRFATQISACM